jgi:mono/diheme cytochrome c family protein
VERRRFRQRSTFLAVIAFVLIAVACGRASDEQIDQALGITPTATINPTDAARESEIAAASAVASPANEHLGVAALGRTKFQFNCQVCHSATGTAPNLLEPGGPYADLDYATLYPIVREGEGGHTPKPGPIPTFKVTDDDIANIAAYIREQAAP